MSFFLPKIYFKKYITHSNKINTSAIIPVKIKQFNIYTYRNKTIHLTLTKCI